MIDRLMARFAPHHLAALLLTSACVLFSPPAATADPFRYSWGHPTPQGNTLFGMAFASDQEGWAVGGGGVVLHTVDGGVSWSFQHGLQAFAPNLYDIIRTPAGSLIACGTGDALFRSVDGGATWSAPAHPPATDLRDLCIAPGGAISAAGDAGTVLWSIDDGLTWVSAGPGTGTIRHHAWRTAAEGYVVGAGISHRTTNGGATWNEFIPAEAFGYNEVYFTTAADGYVLEDFGYWKTTNAGVSWTEHFLPVNPLYRFRTLVLDSQHWLLLCHGEGGELWETTDAGENWTLRQLGGAVGFPCIAQAPGGRVFYTSDTGDLFRTDDLGQTVENATQNFAQNAASAEMGAIYARPDGVLFASNQPTMGEDPVWLRSDDGGATWTEPAQSPGLHWMLTGGFFDNQRGLIGNEQQIRATFDGGATWQNGTLPSTYRLTEVAMPAADRYFAATYRTGAGGGVFRSSDGGLTWNPVGGGLPQGSMAFWDISFPTSMVGYASGATDGSQPFLYKTTDGGSNWQLLSTTGLSSMIRSMNWFDAQRGVASLGFEDPGIHRTTDGGSTWTSVADYSFLRFTRRDANEALALTSFQSYFLRTTDAGVTWEEIHPPLSGPFPGYEDNVAAAAPIVGAWVLGSGRNRITVAREASPAGAPDGPLPPARVINRIALTAEPNPLREGTNLNWNTAVAGPTRIDVFDARGMVVATLVDADLPAGSRTVAWNGKDDRGRTVPGGNYFVKARAGGGTGTVKLTVLR